MTWWDYHHVIARAPCGAVPRRYLAGMPAKSSPDHLATVLAELRDIRAELRGIREELLAPKVAQLREMFSLGQALAARGRELVSAGPSPDEQATAIAEAVYQDLRGRALQLLPVFIALAPHAQDVLRDALGGEALEGVT